MATKPVSGDEVRLGGGMTILGYTRDELGSKINKVLPSAHPIDTPEKLKGRDELLEEIARLLYMDERSVFIFGDRGGGKSSLGATAAFQYQTADKQVTDWSGHLVPPSSEIAVRPR